MVQLRYMRRHLSGILDRKSTRLNSSHEANSYAVFCLKKKKKVLGPNRMRSRGREMHEHAWLVCRCCGDRARISLTSRARLTSLEDSVVWVGGCHCVSS